MSKDIYSKEMLERFYAMRRTEKPRPQAPGPKPRSEPKAEPKQVQEPKPPEKPSEAKPSRMEGIEGWVGRKVRITMRNGQVFEGLLERAWKFEVLLDSGNKKVDLFKHAIDMVELLD
jgi:hypothetical protein